MSGKLCCGVNPIVLGGADCATSVELWPLWPRVDYVDIVDFLVLRTRFVTLKQLKHRKALEGHNFGTSGWVRQPWPKQVLADTVIIVTTANKLSYHVFNLQVSCLGAFRLSLHFHVQVEPLPEPQRAPYASLDTREKRWRGDRGALLVHGQDQRHART